MERPDVEMDAPKGGNARLAWDPELERRFDLAVESLGGLQNAVPSRIKEEMNTDLTLGHIKSHLQKVRRERKVPSLGRRKSADGGAGPDPGAAEAGSSRRPARPRQRRKSTDSGGARYSRALRLSELRAQLESELLIFGSLAGGDPAP